MSDLPTISGSCLCQQIRYEISGDPQVRLLCHCDNCRKATGSSFMANAVYQEDQFRIISGEELLKIYKDSNNSSGNALSRTFCSNCGSPLFITNSVFKGMLTVTSGTMDLGPSKSEWAPQVEVFCQSRREWLPPVEGAAQSKRTEILKTR
ncbi:uncharacterized protein N7496_012715 [Penicillium cataractarum]|uniref:CENP-V/GFA domain-containing protein n=1 Tax=Penicillium cataractarum TaxID=2100454 RepID=A0A9W9R8K3_9EURO|nr:uncharacterized protein N7496_012715 [Penicillium cataractarum]KAJ5355503.1 hypothetical protein N7496_012715 [Penicillium cataractarum]